MKYIKHLCAVLAVLTMIVSALSTAPVSAADDPVANDNPSLPTLNAIANVERVSVNSDGTMDTNGSLGIALCRAAEVTDMEAFLNNCLTNHIIPTVQVDTTEEANVLIDAITAASCKDITAVSADPAVLKRLRNKKTLIRTGLIVTLESTTLSSKEAAAIRAEVRCAPATFCVIDAASATRAAVSELQELAVAVWVEVTAEIGTDEFAVQTATAFTSGANGIISSSATDVATLANDWFEEDTMTRTPIIIGHRGNPSQAPENSLSGFIAAYENGADVFEVDVEIAKDGEIIIMHDDSIKRTTNYEGDKTVNQMTLSEIRQYNLLALDGSVSDEKVPTLREVLEKFRDKDCRIFIEFKGYNTQNVKATAAIVKELDMEDRVDVISFNGNFLSETQKEMPGMSTGFLQSAAGNTTTQERALRSFFSSIAFTQGANSTINTNKGAMSTAYMQVATDRGMTIWPWTYNAATNNQGFLQCPDGLTTDDAQWVTSMYKYIESEDQAVSASVGGKVPLYIHAAMYGHQKDNIVFDGDVDDDAKIIISTVCGDDCLAVKDGEIVATQRGKAVILIGYKTQTTDGSDYVLYSQPITVTVRTIPLYAWGIIGGIVLVGTAVIILLLKKKKPAEE